MLNDSSSQRRIKQQQLSTVQQYGSSNQARVSVLEGLRDGDTLHPKDDESILGVDNIPVAGSAGLEINFPPESHRGGIRARSNSLVSSQLAARKEDRYIRISQEYHSTLPLESQDRPFTQEENENLWKQSAGEPIRGSVYDYPEKAYQKKKCCRKREEREKKREEEIATAKEVENKRYAALQAQLTFLFELGNILPPCPASSDGSDQEGDENDKFDKESEGDENGKSDKESEGDEE
ncbi:hypothetical protein H5410_052108 [Solanum commersonii]|uniref:Uncharacterized protein n=1 Tax=Solanum commersonii TaxID=4109 RepID=A0A9J5WZY1_SOLCO|nr:hypothetical protein H5410_052108 [Solanum commersonii]